MLGGAVGHPGRGVPTEFSFSSFITMAEAIESRSSEGRCIPEMEMDAPEGAPTPFLREKSEEIGIKVN